MREETQEVMVTLAVMAMEEAVVDQAVVDQAVVDQAVVDQAVVDQAEDPDPVASVKHSWKTGSWPQDSPH